MRSSVSRPVRHLVVLAALAAMLAGLAQPAAAAPWFTESFSTGESDVFDGFGWRADASGREGRGLSTRIAKNSHYGANEFVALSDIGQHDRGEMYWRYWLKLDPDFRMEDNDRGKLPGPAALAGRGCRGGTPSTPSAPCWSARMMFEPDEAFDSDGKDYLAQKDRVLLGTYVYHLDAGDFGEEEMWGVGGRIDAGQWYCVEGRVKMNSPGVGNGVVQQWLTEEGDRVASEPVYDRRDFRFRRSGEGDLGVTSMWMNVYYGFGTGSRAVTSPQTQSMWADSLVMGPSRIGCGATPEVTFTDHRGSVHEADIEWLAKRAVTRGCNPPENTRYCPGKDVTRGEMAAFLVRTLELPAAGDAGFRDVPRDHVFHDDINRLAAAGITTGCNESGTHYCPDDDVRREQMAAFLTRALDLPRTDHPGFRDVRRSNKFDGEIRRLAAAGVTRGCNPPDNDRFCPRNSVTREQMASFLRRAAVRPPS